MNEIKYDFLSKKFKVNPNFLLREIGDQCLLIPINDVGILENSMISLDDTSQFLFKQFQTPVSVQDVIEKAKEIYTDSNGVLEQDIYDFINAYLQVGILEEE